MESVEPCTSLIVLTGIATALVGLLVGYQFGRCDTSRDPRPNRRRP